MRDEIGVHIVFYEISEKEVLVSPIDGIWTIEEVAIIEVNQIVIEFKLHPFGVAFLVDGHHFLKDIHLDEFVNQIIRSGIA